MELYFIYLQVRAVGWLSKTGMGILLKASIKKSWFFEGYQAFASLAAYLRGRDVLADSRGVLLPPVAPAFGSANRRDWVLSPTELWACINRITCCLSQLPVLDRCNFKLTAQNVFGRLAKFDSQMAPEPYVIGSSA